MNIDVVEVSTAWVWWVGHVQVGQAVLPDHHDHHYDDVDDDGSQKQSSLIIMVMIFTKSEG